MATQEKTWNVANRMHSQKDSDNPEVNHIIAGADEIYDDSKGMKQSDINAQNDAAFADRYTKGETYSKEQLDALITTPDVNYVTVATFAELPQTGEADTIYRVSSYNGTQVDASKYALYAWNGATYQLLAVRSAVGEVFDVSEYNSGATYETLTAALNAVPASVRKGGMSIKFVLISDNKYVQYRLMLSTFTAAQFGNEANWQGIGAIEKDSKNIPDSATVYNAFKNVGEGFNAIARYSGTTGTAYAYRQEVNIPSGVVVRNIGIGNIRLYDVRDGNYITVAGGKTIETTFAITWIRGYSGTNNPYDLFVYADKEIPLKINELEEVKVDKNPGKNLFDPYAKGIVPNMYISGEGSAQSPNHFISDFIPVEAETGYHVSDTNDNAIASSGSFRFYDAEKNRLSETLSSQTQITTPLDCAYIKLSVLYAAEDVMFNKGTERGDYVPYTPIGEYTDGIALNAEHALTEVEKLVTEETQSVSFTNTYQRRQLQYTIKNGSVIKSITVGGVEGTMFGRTTSSDSEDALTLNSGTVVTKDINYVKNNSVKGEYSIVLYSDLSLMEAEIQNLQNKIDDLDVTEVKNAVHFVKDSSETATVGSLATSESLSLDNYPYAMRKGDNIMLSSKVTTFSKIKIGKGCETVYLNCWFEIDDTNVKLYRYKSTTAGGTATVEETVQHGLTIASMLNVNIVFNGTISLIIQSSDGVYKHTFDQEDFMKYYNQKGYIRVISDGTTLTDVRLSATNKDFQRPIWIFGASYSNVAQSQMIGALKGLGYFNFLLHGYPGCDSSTAYAHLQKALALGTPQVLVWAIMSNDASDSTWQNYATNVANICIQKGIELIFVNYPDMREKEFSARRNWVINGGYRYIDLVAAVEASPYVYDTDFWYTGMMGSDGVHPTELGANAMAMQILTDFPEIMQYGQSPDYAVESI